MTLELIAILAVGGALGGMFLYLARGQAELRREILELRDETAKEFTSVRGEMAREFTSGTDGDGGHAREYRATREGVFEGFAAGEDEPAPAEKRRPSAPDRGAARPDMREDVPALPGGAPRSSSRRRASRRWARRTCWRAHRPTGRRFPTTRRDT